MKYLLFNFFFFCVIMSVVAQKQNEPTPYFSLDCLQDKMRLSPNGDGLEDYWRLDCIFNTKNEVSVLDRWGSPIFTQKSYKGTWDGRDKSGKPFPSGTYIYLVIIHTQNGEKITKQGTLSII